MIVCSTNVIKDATGEAATNADDMNQDMNLLSNEARLLRKLYEKSADNQWDFTGSFTDYHVPQELEFFLRQLIVGQYESTEDVFRDNIIKSQVNTISHMILNSLKSSRQSLYKPKSKESYFRTRNEYPTQLAVGLAIHQSTRSKKLLAIMSGMGLS